MNRTEFLNGGNVPATIEALMDAHNACATALACLYSAAPHGRDYVNGFDDQGYQADRAAFERAAAALRSVEEYCMNEAAALDNWEYSISKSDRAGSLKGDA
jgi:hypothetical protein